MDALEFVRNYREMLEKRGFGLWITSDENTPEEIVAETEKWAAEHPVKTRQSEFLKLFPGAAPTKDGVIAICPNAFSPVYKDEWGLCKRHYAECDNCCREFWLAEVEDA